MSRYSYGLSRDLIRRCDDFDALLMATMRKADTKNFALLASAFPLQAQELQARFDAPMGLLVGESYSREGITYYRASDGEVQVTRGGL